MTHRNWSHSAHYWHLAHRPALVPLSLPRPRMTLRRLCALRRGLIVALCALLAGGLTFHLRSAAQGPFAPTSIEASSRA
jgi:hypothetical protein